MNKYQTKSPFEGVNVVFIVFDGWPAEFIEDEVSD
jgi:hypothetical protein